ncbi:MAG: HlyD family efflux transporter periplasmic adaptor subunit [Lachnospiraceae bacterium]
MEEQKKVVKYSAERNFRKVYVMAAIVIIYLIGQVIRFLTSEQIYLYNVPTATEYAAGGMYTGVIVREEECYVAESSGIINYYVSSGSRIGKNDVIYSLDNNGAFAQQLELMRLDMDLLSRDSLIKIKDNLELISAGYSSDHFDKIYEQKAYLKSMLLEALNEEAIKNMDPDLLVGFESVYAPESGLLSFATDNYDGLTQEQINQDIFNQDNFKVKYIYSGEKVEKGEVVYRLVKNEFFDLIFLMSDDIVAEYSNQTSMTVELKDFDITVTGDFTTFVDSDNQTYGKISFNRYGSQVCSQRFLNFEIVSDDVTGYKIPASAVTQQRAIKIPAKYCGQQNGSDCIWFNIGSKENPEYEKRDISILGSEIVEMENDEDGNVDSILYYYVYCEGLEIGQTIYHLEKESEDTNVGDSQIVTSYTPEDYILLDGVYNANRGYCVFRRVDILTRTKDGKYCVLRPKMAYSISPYDLIVIDAEKVYEGKLLYN